MTSISEWAFGHCVRTGTNYERISLDMIVNTWKGLFTTARCTARCVLGLQCAARWKRVLSTFLYDIMCCIPVVSKHEGGGRKMRYHEPGWRISERVEQLRLCLFMFVRWWGCAYVHWCSVVHRHTSTVSDHLSMLIHSCCSCSFTRCGSAFRLFRVTKTLLNAKLTEITIIRWGQ